MRNVIGQQSMLHETSFVSYMQSYVDILLRNTIPYQFWTIRFLSHLDPIYELVFSIYEYRLYIFIPTSFFKLWKATRQAVTVTVSFHNKPDFHFCISLKADLSTAYNRPMYEDA